MQWLKREILAFFTPKRMFCTKKNHVECSEEAMGKCQNWRGPWHQGARGGSRGAAALGAAVRGSMLLEKEMP